MNKSYNKTINNEKSIRGIFKHHDTSLHPILENFVSENSIVDDAGYDIDDIDYIIEHDILTEGLSVDKDGNVFISIKKKGSYMDQYMENHRLLHNAYKNNDTESIKYHLAVAFAMINKLEREIYKSSDKNNTALRKARASFINDFKSYSKKLNEIEPDFDFAEFYNNSNFDKYLANVSIDNIKGIRQIIKVLLG